MNPQPPPPPPMPHLPPHEPRVDYENGGLNPEKCGDQPALILVMNIINTLTHLVLGAVTILALMLANTMGSVTELNSMKQHIYLCTIGYILLMSQAVLTLNPFNGWSRTLKHQQKRTIHWVMQISGSILAITGSIIRINGVNNNFETAHGILGLIAMLFTILSLIGGVVNLFCGHDIKLMKVFHACIGILTLSIAYLCLIFGFHDTIYRLIQGDTNTNLAISLTVIGFIGTIISACSNVLRRILS